MSASSQILLPSSEAISGYYLQWKRQIRYIERNRRPALLLIICRELSRSRLSSFSNTMPNLAGLSSAQLKNNFSHLSSASSLSVKCLDMRILNQMDQKTYFLCFYSQVVNKEFKIMIEINHVTRYSVGSKGNSRRNIEGSRWKWPEDIIRLPVFIPAFAYCFTSNGGVWASETWKAVGTLSILGLLAEKSDVFSPMLPGLEGIDSTKSKLFIKEKMFRRQYT